MSVVLVLANNNCMEFPLFFRSSKNKLFGTFFIPDGEKVSDANIVLCHPFAEEKKCSQAILVKVARILCKLGYPVFLFDFFGCGDSTGEFENAKISIWIENTQDAIMTIREYTGINRIILGGLRLGGFIAIKTAEKANNISQLLLIEPVLNPSEYFVQILRRKQIKELKTDGMIKSNLDKLIEGVKNKENIDFEGYNISSEFYNDLILNARFEESTISNIQTTLLHINYKNKLSKEFKDLQGAVRLKVINILPFWNKLNSVDCKLLYDEIHNAFDKW